MCHRECYMCNLTKNILETINVLFRWQEVEADLKATEEGGRDSHWSQSVTKYVESFYKGPEGPQV